MSDHRKFVDSLRRRSVTFAQVIDMRMPDLRQGLCALSQEGRDIADAGFNTELTLSGFDAREKAKDQCRRCAKSIECAEWVRIAEWKSPGSLGGVYAGMDRWDREGRPIRIDRRTMKVEG